MSPQIKILVVDDEAAILVLCEHLLEMGPYEVVTATDATAALEILQDQRMDLLLADIRLPDMDGFELIAEARKIQPEIAVVAMTGYRTVETAIKALRSGLDGLVIKPYELGAELLEIVKSALQERQRQQNLVSLQRLQPLFRLGNSALLETSPQATEKTTVQVMGEVLEVGRAGVFIRGGTTDSFHLIGCLGDVLGEDDPFWKIPQVVQASEAEVSYRFTTGCNDDAALAETLERLGWSGLMLVSLRRRKDHYLFYAIRDEDEPTFLRSDLELLEVLAKQACVTLENTRLFANLARITRQVETAGGILQQAERMSTIEKVMPSLVKQLDSPVQSIKNSLYLASRPEIRGDKAGYYLTLAQKELYHLEGILQQMTGLTLPVCDDLAAVEPETLLKGVLDTLATKLKEQAVQVRTNYARPLPALHGSRDLLSLALFSLILNATEAMKGIEGEKMLWIEASSQRQRVRITLEDSGPGFDAHHPEKGFKPFQTGGHDGTGIGLMVSQRIIEAQQGKLNTIPSSKGSGTCLEILLPVEKTD